MARRINPFQAGPGVFNPAGGGQQQGHGTAQRRQQESQRSMQQQSMNLQTQQVSMNQESARAAIENAKAQNAIRRQELAYRHHANMRKFEDNKLVRAILQKQNAGLLKAENDKIQITRDNAALARKKWLVQEGLTKAQIGSFDVQTKRAQLAVDEAIKDIPFRAKERERVQREAAATEARNIRVEKERREDKRLQRAKDQHTQLQKMSEATLKVITGGMATAEKKVKMAREGGEEHTTLFWNSRKDRLVNLDELHAGMNIGKGSPIANAWNSVSKPMQSAATEGEAHYTKALKENPQLAETWRVAIGIATDPNFRLDRDPTQLEKEWAAGIRKYPETAADMRYAIGTLQEGPYVLGSRTANVPILKMSSADRLMNVVRASGQSSKKGLLRIERYLETMVGGDTLELGATGKDKVYGPNLFKDEKTGKLDYVGFASDLALVTRLANPKKTEEAPPKMVQTARALLAHMNGAELETRGLPTKMSGTSGWGFQKGAVVKTLFPAQEIARWKQPLDKASLSHHLRHIGHQIKVEAGAHAIIADVDQKIALAALIKDPVKRSQVIDDLKALVRPAGTPGWMGFPQNAGKAWQMLDDYKKELDKWTDPATWSAELETRRIGTAPPGAKPKAKVNPTPTTQPATP